KRCVCLIGEIMLIRAIDRADVAALPMAVEADLLLRPRFGRNVNGTIEIAEHGVVELLYAVELGLEVSSRAGTYVAFDTCHLRMRCMLGSDKLRFHWYMTALATKIHRLGVLISFVTAEGSQKEKADSAEREQRQDSPVTFPRQVDVENTVFLFKMPCATLRAFVQYRAEESKREAKKQKERCDDIREDADVRILRRCEEINGEEKNKSE